MLHDWRHFIQCMLGVSTAYHSEEKGIALLLQSGATALAGQTTPGSTTAFGEVASLQKDITRRAIGQELEELTLLDHLGAITVTLSSAPLDGSAGTISIHTLQKPRRRVPLPLSRVSKSPVSSYA